MEDHLLTEYWFYMDVLSVLASVSLMLFARFVMGFKPRKVLFWIICFVLLGLLLAYSFIYSKVSMVSYLFHLVIYILIYFTYRPIKFRYLFFADAFISTISGLAYNLIGNCVGSIPMYVEPLTYGLVLVLLCILFLSKFRHLLRELLIATPRWVLNFATIVLSFIYAMNSFFIADGWFRSAVRYNIEIDEFIAAFQSVSIENLSQGVDNLPQVVGDAYDTLLLWPMATTWILVLEFMIVFTFVIYIFTVRAKNNLKQQNENFEKQIEAQAEHYRNLAEANAEVRRFKHDFKNLRFAIEQLLADGRKQDAVAVMQEFSETLNSSSRTMILFDTGNGIADALLTDKLRKAHQHQTMLTFQGTIAQNALAPTDLCVLLGNSIDNAMEACEKLPAEIERKISVECQCSSGFMFLTVRNPIEKPVPICDDFLPSTKKDKALHGFGISSMHKVAKKYDGSLKLSSEGGFFTVNIELCIPVANISLAG